MCDLVATINNEQIVLKEPAAALLPPPIVNGHHPNNNHHHHHYSSSSSSSKKHVSSSSSSRDKDKDKDKDKDRHREHHKSSSSKDHKSSKSDKDRHHSSSNNGKDKHRDKERKSSNSHHSSSNSHRDKDKEREKDKDKDKEKVSKSSTSSSNHHHKSSTKDKDRKDRDRGDEKHKDKDKEHRSERKERDEKDRHRDKDRHHHKSSTSSSHASKSRDHGHKSSSSSHKHSSSKTASSTNSHKHATIKKTTTEEVFAKPVPVEPDTANGSALSTNAAAADDKNNSYIHCNGFSVNGGGGSSTVNNSSMVEENFNNVSQASSCDYSMSQFKSDEPAFVIKQEATLTDGENDNDEETNHNNTSATINQTSDGDDLPLAVRKRKQIKMESNDDEDDEDVPLVARKKIKKEHKDEKKKKRKHIKVEEEDEDDDDDYVERKPKVPQTVAAVKPANVSPPKRVKKEKKEEDEEVWRWWEEEKRDDGVKWNTLEHKGPVFAPPYERLPSNVRFYYGGRAMELTEATEEAATFYAKMLNHDYCTKDIFNTNFFKDFRKVMSSKERDTIRDFSKCNFQEMFEFFQAESEKRKAATKEQKLAKKEENEALIQEYGYCYIDGHREKIANFRLEPPGLFRGRGEHPKMGMIKKRVRAGDISINCGKNSKIPSPPPGERWKEVRHDNSVTWLVSWVENVQGQVKYIMLNPSSKLKGEKDHVKYETARRLAKSIDKIRATYRDEWKSKEMRVRQRAVALYFIDKLALRAGNEKDEDQADTVGCCSLRVEHVTLHEELNGKECVVAFDFLGKDSIRYYNEVEVEKRVFKNLELFMENKKAGDDLFDRLNTQVLNEHLKELMDGLTAKVFRTYNASITLQNQLDLLTEDDMTVPEKLLAYNRANRAVAILCNHQRSVPKGHEKSMENIKLKIKAKREAIKQCEGEYRDAKKAAKHGSVKEKMNADKKAKQLERLQDQLKKLELQETDRDENKTIALGTSKLNYLDPRITVAWCKKHEVPIEKIFNKTQRNKFLWAIHMADENYRF